MQNPTDIPSSRFREPFFEERARETSWGIPHNHRQPLFGMGRTAQRAPRGCAPPSHLRQAPRVHRAAARQPLAPDAGRMVSCHARRMQSGPKSLAGASAGGRMPGDRAPLLHAHDPNRLKNRPHALRDTPTRTCRLRSTAFTGLGFRLAVIEAAPRSDG